MPISFILLYTAFYAVRQESRRIMYGVLATCVGAAGFFTFKVGFLRVIVLRSRRTAG